MTNQVESRIALKIHAICKAACGVCLVSEADFFGRTRHAAVVRARRVAIRAIRASTLASYPEIEAATGVRHSTWMVRENDARKLLLASDQTFAEAVKRCIEVKA